MVSLEGCFPYVIIHPVIKFRFLSLLVNDDVVVHQTMTNNYLFSRELSTTTLMSFLPSLCINQHNFQVCLFVY